MNRWYVWLMRSVLLISLAAFVVGGYGLQRARHQRHDLCIAVEALKKIQFDDLTSRIMNTRTFLAQHPHGIPGISAADLRKNINQMIITRVKYAPRSCP